MNVSIHAEDGQDGGVIWSRDIWLNAFEFVVIIEIIKIRNDAACRGQVEEWTTHCQK